jgi:ATP-binding cassette subfamily B protein
MGSRRLASTAKRARSRLTWYAGLLRTFYRAGKAPTLLLAGVVLVTGVGPTLFILASGSLIGALPGTLKSGLSSSSGRTLVGSTIAVAVIFALQQVAPVLREGVGRTLARRVDALLQSSVMAAVMAPSGIGHLEDEALQTQIGVAAPGLCAGWFTPGSAASSLSGRMATALRIIGAGALLLTFHWWLAIGLLAIATWYGWEYQFVARRLADQQTSLTKGFSRANYYRDLALESGPAKEVQVFGLGAWLGAKFADEWARVATGYAHSLAAQARRMSASTFALVLAAVGSYLVLGWESASGLIGLASIAIYAQAIYGVVLGYANAIGPADSTLAAYAVEGFHAAEAAIRSVAVAPSNATKSADGLPRSAIRFEQVRFAYGPQHSEVLSGLDLTIPAGHSLAIVGLNGAGKTTTIKLLSGFYSPTGGRITVDGIDLAELDPKSWRRRISAVFQDFVHYPMTALENITLGYPITGPDDAALRSAADKAMAEELVANLPQGWDTLLTKDFKAGVELSGGEWQRIALARALLRAEKGASVLILDEPTAALDVRAEALLYERFLSITAGLTSIVISHRFSTVRRAERICVIADGRLAEEGSHDQLLDRGGKYAEMFKLQAARFDLERTEAAG